MNARWQIRRMIALRPNVMIYIDEPFMALFGSAFIAASREQVITSIDEVIAAIHAEGAMAGVYCCGNTDWSVLMETQVDILNLDAHSYLESLSLYPHALWGFLDRGGVVAWGILPNDERALEVSPQSIADSLIAGLNLISRRAEGQGVNLPHAAFLNRSLLTPSCGLGSSSERIADRVVELLDPTRKDILSRLGD